MLLDMLLPATLLALGNHLFGHFEAQTPRWWRLAKAGLSIVMAPLLSRRSGRAAMLGWTFVFLGLGLTVHIWWCRRHGIDPLTAEPREKYEALRGWHAAASAARR